MSLIALLALAAATPQADRAAILGTIHQMEDAWNRGDFRGYMAGFKNPDVIFVSGGKFQEGWQGTLDHYVRDYGGSPERRGKLHFYNIYEGGRPGAGRGDAGWSVPHGARPARDRRREHAALPQDSWAVAHYDEPRFSL